MTSKYDIIEEALAARARLHIVYRDFHGDVTRRDITPLYWEGPDKVRAFCHLRGEERSFKVWNMLDCQPIGPESDQTSPSRRMASSPDAQSGMPISRSAANPAPAGPPVASILPQGASLAPTPVPVTSTHKKQHRQPSSSSPPFSQVQTAGQWSRLMKYYTECLKREYRQQHQIKNDLAERQFFSAERSQIYAFMEGTTAFEFVAGPPHKPSPLASFMRQILDKRQRDICIGYPVLALDSNLLAPLLLTQVTVEEQNDKLRLVAEGIEVSYAALKGINLDEEQIALVLEECDRIEPEAGQSKPAALETFLSQRLSEFLGRPLIQRAWNAAVTEFVVAGTLYMSPCVFGVKPERITRNLIQELEQLSDESMWESVPSSLRQLLSAIPEHEYPGAPDIEHDPVIYVTAAYERQRQAVAAAQHESVTIVTGPPGTGKSQLVLNLIAQAVMRNETVLFASRNNKAVDVVLNRLRGEVGFKGAVRTGSSVHRKRAAQDMATALDQLTYPGNQRFEKKLRAQYHQAKRQITDAEAMLDRVRRLSGLLRSHQAEREDLLKVLPSKVAQLAEAHQPKFQNDEIEHLEAALSDLLAAALSLQEEQVQMAARIRHIVKDNELKDPLIDSLQHFESQWGTFGDGFLQPARLNSLEQMHSYVTQWAALIPVLDIQRRVTQLSHEFRGVNASLTDVMEKLPGTLHEHVKTLASELEPEQLKEIYAKAQQYRRRVDALDRGKQSLWLKLLTWLGLKDPVQDLAKDIGALQHILDLDWKLPTAPKKDDLDLLRRACLRAITLSAACQIYLETERLRALMDSEQTKFDETSGRLAQTLRDDVTKVDLQTEATPELRSTMADILRLNKDLIERRDQLAGKINSLLDANNDALQMLSAYRASPAGSDKKLWTLPERAELHHIILHLNKWRNLVALWKVNAAIQHQQKQISTLPSETDALARVKLVQKELDKCGARLVKASWEDRVNDLGVDVLQQAWDYIHAVEQLESNRGNNSAPYSMLKSREEANVPAALSVFPVWATTNLSVKSNFPLRPALFDIAIIDEASQCDVASALPLLFRAKRIVIIGDPQQLKHVATLYPDSDISAAESLGIASDAFSYSTHSLYDIAQRCAGNRPGRLLLNEHYRSHPRIIGFSNAEFYDNKLNIRTDMERLNLSPLFLRVGSGVFWLHAPGQARQQPRGSAINLAEIEGIQTFLPRLLDLLARHKMGHVTLGIVTPYHAQEEHIKQWLERPSRDGQFSSDRILVGTAHKFQGDERDIMIFSPVMANGLSKGSLAWLERTSNLLNVAATRARVALIIIGDWDYCRSLPATSKYRRLADYADRQNQVVRRIDELSLFQGEPIDIVGTLLDWHDRHYNRMTLRKLLLSCKDFIWWMDPYMQDHLFDLMLDVCQHPDCSAHEIRLLTALEQVETTDGGRPKLHPARVRALQAELQQRGITIQLALLPKRDLPHDRFLYSQGQAINMPPFGGAYGDHKMVSEYTPSSTSTEFFEKYWSPAQKV